MLLEGYFVVKCGCQKKGYICDLKERGKCESCNRQREYTPIKKCTDPDMLIIAAESELENANYHEMSSLPSDLFDRIKKIVGPKRHLELAKAIIEAMPL